MHFSINILEVKTNQILQAWDVPVSNRPYWRLYWADTEGASLRFNGNNYLLRPGTWTLITPRTTFSPQTTGTAINHMLVHFQLAGVFAQPTPGIFSIDHDLAFDDFAHLGITANDLPRPERILTLTKLISEACLNLDPTVWEKEHPDQRIRRVLKAMDAHIAAPLSNPELAEIAHLSAPAFSRLFKESLGTPPQAFYLSLRLEHASFLLESTDDEIDLIAEQCGFCDRNYFSTVFRQHYEAPPATFRKLSRKT